jgi:hypothetical protein
MKQIHCNPRSARLSSATGMRREVSRHCKLTFTPATRGVEVHRLRGHCRSHVERAADGDYRWLRSGTEPGRGSDTIQVCIVNAIRAPAAHLGRQAWTAPRGGRTRARDAPRSGTPASRRPLQRVTTPLACPALHTIGNWASARPNRLQTGHDLA